MYYVYIIESKKTGRYYVGQTNNLSRRLDDHNRGKDHTSKCGKPWKLIFEKQCLTRSDAIKCERQLKSFKSRKYLQKIINAAG